MKKIILTIIATISVLSLTVPAVVMAQSANPAKDAVCQGVGLASGGNGCVDSHGGITVNSVIDTTINVLSFVVGVAAVIMIIINGLRFVTSSGDPAKVSSARDGILYAVVGLVVVLLSQTVVKFVVNKFS